ncbi:hypothetical protein GCM10009682_11440 [Luedemannella flava]|uniref:Uncharacterized protein n=1 Tax=Luedemannella flava TaxID=349316 RepID=A0ABN2LJS5_9ACTN
MSGPFYLSGLLSCCGSPMWCVTRTGTRRYRCGVCGRGVDALAAEVEVWELVHTSHPGLGNAHTAYEERRHRLDTVVWTVEVIHGRAGHRFVPQVFAPAPEG